MLYRGPKCFAFSVRLYGSGMQQNYIAGEENPPEVRVDRLFLFFKCPGRSCWHETFSTHRNGAMDCSCKTNGTFLLSLRGSAWRAKYDRVQYASQSLNAVWFGGDCLRKARPITASGRWGAPLWVQKIFKCRRWCYTVLRQKYGLTG